MKIIHDKTVATDLGPRRIIRVVMNPDDPEAVHQDGKPHTGEPPPGTSPALRSWEWCHDCRYNWDVTEFIWTGDDLYTRNKDGTRGRPKTNSQLLAEMRRRFDIPTLPGNPSLVDTIL